MLAGKKRGSYMTVQPSSINANLTVENLLKEYLEKLEQELQADVLVYIGPITYGVDSELRNAIELRQKRRKKLAVILETEGGYIEVAERLANLFRHYYSKSVEFIVPNFAMSAGTVLVMSGDSIYMDYFSVLGPIDPQVEQEGGFIPALGYLEKYDELIEKSKKGNLTQAELHFLIAKFDPAMLHKYEQAKELSISLLKEWLVKYKFKNWKITKTRKMTVTPQMRKERAEEIGEKLNKTKIWHTHSKCISMQTLRRYLKLEIEDIEEMPTVNKYLKEYYQLLTDYMAKRELLGLVHVREEFRPIFGRR
jgi:ClpP class serine protease